MAVFVITGTSSGLGLTTAVHFARRGHHVYATMRDTARAGDLETAAKSAGVNVLVRELDVTKDPSVQRALEDILAEANRVDVLVNNAGVGKMTPWEQTPIEEIVNLVDTNFLGAVRCTQAVLPSMREQGSGAIVNVSSVLGRIGAPIQGPYCATKFALVGFTESLAVEVRRFGIKVAAVLPGFISTPMLQRSWEGYQPDNDNPYEDLLRRWWSLYQQAPALASDPSEVAEAIEALIDNDELFRVVGDTGRSVIDGRQRMSDAEWLRYGDRQSDEEWFNKFMSDFPMAQG